MAYIVPTAADLKAAFPAFIAVPDDTVTFWIGRAGRIVDTSWTEGDYNFAQMLLAAHYMVEQGLGTGAEAQAAAAGASGFKVMRSGALSLERFDAAPGASGAGYSSTAYGRQFYELLMRNRGGPIVQATGVPLDGIYPEGLGW
jgi:hypothetical protein